MNNILSNDRLLELVRVSLHETAPRFMTSADVVMKASGLRIEAVQAIARERGVEIKDIQSKCIDENLLEDLANAHVRRLKSYFNNSRRHISELSGAEVRVFVDFCITFKKHRLSSAADKWDDIDTNAIREQFFKKVNYSTTVQCDKKSFTSLSSSLCEHLVAEHISKAFKENENVCSTNSSISNQFPIICDAICSYSDSYRDTDYTRDFLRKDEIIKSVIHSRWYNDKPIHGCIIYTDKREIVRRVTLSARYHIFSNDDDELLYDTRNMYFRAYREVV